MEFVKRYIHPTDYRNVILVNKQWNTIFSTIKETVMLHYLLKENGWLSKYTRNVILRKELSASVLLECFIESFNERTSKIVYPRYKEPFNGVIVNKIKKRFPWLNICGY